MVRMDMVIDSDAIRSAIKAAGGSKVLREQFDRTTQAIWLWTKNGVPPGPAMFIHQKTGVPLATLSPQHYAERSHKDSHPEAA